MEFRKTTRGYNKINFLNHNNNYNSTDFIKNSSTSMKDFPSIDPLYIVSSNLHFYKNLYKKSNILFLKGVH